MLYVKLAKTGPVLLSGDLYHFPQMRILQRMATFDFDEDRTRATRAAIEAFSTRTGTTPWIEHDAAANAKLKKGSLLHWSKIAR